MTPSHVSGEKTPASSHSELSGKLFVVSAPSGAGKTTLCRAMRQRFSGLKYSVSYTTRKPRQGETDGTDYRFISVAAFKKGISEDQWAEWAQVHGNYYGTSAIWLNEQMDKGYDVLLDIDVQGARQIMNRYADHCITVFIMPPDVKTLRSRLAARGTDDDETVARRMKNAVEEMDQRHLYKHVIVNDDLNEAIDTLSAVISGDSQDSGRA